MKNIISIVEKHFPNFKEVPRGSISIDDEVRKMCEQNVCEQYGKNWTCPPAVGSPDEIRRKIAEFKKLIIVYKVYNIENSYDIKGMLSGIADFRGMLI